MTTPCELCPVELTETNKNRHMRRRHGYVEGPLGSLIPPPPVKVTHVPVAPPNPKPIDVSGFIENKDFPWPSGVTLNRRRILAGMLWVLVEHGGEFQHPFNASGMMRAACLNRDVPITQATFQTAMQLFEDLGCVKREITGRRTKRILLTSDILPRNPLKSLVVEPPEETTEEIEAEVHALDEAIALRLGLPALELEINIEEPTWVAPVPVTTDDPRDKLLAAMSLINDALIGGIESPSTQHPDMALRLANALQANEVMRRRLREAQDIAHTHKDRADNLFRINRQLQANVEALRKQTPINTKKFDELTRLMQETPKNGVRSGAHS